MLGGHAMASFKTQPRRSKFSGVGKAGEYQMISRANFQLQTLFHEQLNLCCEGSRSRGIILVPGTPGSAGANSRLSSPQLQHQPPEGGSERGERDEAGPQRRRGVAEVALAAVEAIVLVVAAVDLAAPSHVDIPAPSPVRFL